MKTLTIFLLFLFLPFGSFAFASNSKILVFGDSLSAAYNIPTEKGWVTLLQNKLVEQKFTTSITNASISGETSSGGLVRFQSQLDKTMPDIVILELGANDGLRGYDLSTTHQNLLKMVNMSHQKGAKVLLAGVHMPPNYGRTYTQKFDRIFTELAKMEKVKLIPFILEGVATNQDLMLRDGLHPNEKGQQVIVETVSDYLMPMLQPLHQ